MRELGIRTDYDLRSPSQIAKLGGAKSLEGIERVHAPLLNGGGDEGVKGDEEGETKKRYEMYAADGTEVSYLLFTFRLSF